MFLQSPSFGDVPENKHAAHDLAVLAANRRGAVINVSLCAVFGYEYGVVSQSDDDAFLQRPRRWALNLLPRFLIHYVEDRI